MIQNFEKDLKNIEQQINIISGANLQLIPHTTIKNNSQEKQGIIVKMPGVDVNPIVYMDDILNRLSEDTSQIAREILNLCANLKQQDWWKNKDYLISDYESVRKKIALKLVNTKLNEKLLGDAPSRNFLDLSLLYEIVIETTEEGKASILVRNEILKMWGVEETTLWEDAIKNTQKLFPEKLSSINDILAESLSEGYTAYSAKNLFDNKNPNPKLEGMYVLTNLQRSNGATVIVYPGMLEKIGQFIGKNYCILPSSTEELIVIPFASEINTEELNEMIREINQTQVKEEERLADHCYLYIRERKELVIP